MHLCHTAVTRLYKASIEIRMIAAVTCHGLESCEAIVDGYIVQTIKLAEKAFRKRLEHESEG